MIPGKIFTSFSKFQRIVSVNDFRLPLGFQELLQASLGFLISFCFARIQLDPLGGQFLHHDCISMIVSRFTIFTENFVICCFQVTKNFCTRYCSAIASSAWGPCNFGPFTDLAVSVFREMSVSTVLTQLLTSLGCGLSSWEELACESLCSGTLSSTRFSLISCIHSWISELNGARAESANNGFPRSIVDSSFVFGFGLAWGRIPESAADNGVSPCYHLFNTWTWHKHWRGINSTLILSFSSLTVAWCCRWWRRRAWGRWRMMTFLSWRCPWSWRMRTGWRTRWEAWNHDRNEVFRVTLYPNPVFDEMWFLTVDPFIRISDFIAKLSERRRLLAYPRGLSLSRICLILWHTPLPPHAFALLHWLLWLSWDSTISSRYPFQHHSSPFCWSCALTHRSRQQMLVPQV